MACDVNLVISIKENLFLPIRESIVEILHELKQLRKDTEHTEGWAESFGNQLGKVLGREVKLAWAQSVTEETKRRMFF